MGQGHIIITDNFIVKTRFTMWFKDYTTEIELKSLEDTILSFGHGDTIAESISDAVRRVRTIKSELGKILK